MASTHDSKKSNSADGVIALVAFRTAGHLFAIDLQYALRAIPACEIVELPTADTMPPIGALRFEGSLVPVLDPARLLRMTSAMQIVPSTLFLLARPRDRIVAFVVDTVLGVRHIDIGAIARAERLGLGMSRLSGVAPDIEGLIHIFDPERVLTDGEEAAIAAASA
ncbi:MAG: chemotaxis protein CheW [Alphaproteobacteria bacterium]|nr:chemotaxis protein CheW [Alphaproteobacteria bacterium]